MSIFDKTKFWDIFDFVALLDIFAMAKNIG